MTDSRTRIDLDDLRRRLGGDEALIADLFQLFLDHYATELKAIDAAVIGGNREAVRRAAHTFKGMARNISATRAADLAMLLEQISEREAGDLDEPHRRLVNEVEQLAAELRQSIQPARTTP
jgi:HPt (histidine-containing phosphotransfer) domain-containing protein